MSYGDHISSFFITPSGFQIKSKKNAAEFLKILQNHSSGEIMFADLDKPGNYIIYSHGGVFERAKGTDIMVPNLVLCDEDAVNLIYKKRKSINSRLNED